MMMTKRRRGAHRQTSAAVIGLMLRISECRIKRCTGRWKRKHGWWWWPRGSVHHQVAIIVHLSSSLSHSVESTHLIHLIHLVTSTVIVTIHHIVVCIK
ncbi:hypothetical protein BCR42DRAFT_409307 [Absidia repens]|uniref:Uncharacterized protein n=1 Tax=Absidia repens TaxID=90262 RepID=A0A1X2IR21_9FUNG|nr:hypothetical protein BCR42DRAFT_409307 [Absidia repens]